MDHRITSIYHPCFQHGDCRGKTCLLRWIKYWEKNCVNSVKLYKYDLFCIFCLNLAVVFVSNFYGFLTVFIIILTCVALSYIIVHIVTAIAVMRSCGFDPKNVGTPVSFISMVILGIVLYYEAIFNGNFYSNLITLLMVIGSFVTLLFLNVFRRNYLSKVEFEQAIWGNNISRMFLYFRNSVIFYVVRWELYAIGWDNGSNQRKFI